MKTQHDKNAFAAMIITDTSGEPRRQGGPAMIHRIHCLFRSHGKRIALAAAAIAMLASTACNGTVFRSLLGDDNSLTYMALAGAGAAGGRSEYIPPYMLNITNPSTTTVVVTYNEKMKTGGGTGAADCAGNYAITKVSDGSAGPSIISVAEVETSESSREKTMFRITLGSALQSSTVYKVRNTAAEDLAGNTITDPTYLTFTSGERLKVISASAATSTQVKVLFSKPVDTTTAGTKTNYTITPSSVIGAIQSASVGTGDEANTVTLTLAAAPAMEGVAYTVVANSAIYQSGDASDMLDSSPRDRATFLGLGSVIDEITDGTYFEDPFADGTSYSWSFAYRNRVYLGTNDTNTGAFRFDANGLNSTLVTFDADAKLNAGAKGFGYASSANSGFNYEEGVVGFTNGHVTVDGTDYEILLAGPLNSNSALSYGYFTQDADTTLNWIRYPFSGTGGSNTRSLQTVYAFNNNILSGAASDHNTQAPSCSLLTLKATLGVLAVDTVNDVTTIKDYNHLGKNGVAYWGASTYKNTTEVIGIDSTVRFGSKIYFGNCNGIVNVSGLSIVAGVASFSSVNASTPSGFTSPTTSYTLVLPTSANGGLGKLTPGQRGIPRFLEYNGRLYMARNVAVGLNAVDRNTHLRGELWKCDPGSDGVCDPSDWTRIISGAESEIGTAKSISMLEAMGNGHLYVGYDDAVNGARVFRVNSADPAATDGSTLSSAGWSQRGTNGLGNGYDTIFSSASIEDNDFYYFYFTAANKDAGSPNNAIRVFRERTAK